MHTVLNIAAYRFVHVTDVAASRDRLHAAALGQGLLGTILVAEEGINLCLAGTEPGIGSFLQALGREAGLADLEVKRSWSAAPPFRRLRVRVRPEIIRMEHPLIRPGRARAPAIDAATLKRWLDRGCDDAGRPLLLLDTRNDYEVEAGRFNGALDLKLKRFSDFPAAASAARESLLDRAVVSYCTGGIRCEKAALYLSEIGVTHHWQLDGGILRYFEAVGGEHFDGVCTVFDERAALDAELKPSL